MNVKEPEKEKPTGAKALASRFLKSGNVTEDDEATIAPTHTVSTTAK
jgi:hypothetical protein